MKTNISFLPVNINISHHVIIGIYTTSARQMMMMTIAYDLNQLCLICSQQSSSSHYLVSIIQVEAILYFLLLAAIKYY